MNKHLDDGDEEAVAHKNVIEALWTKPLLDAYLTNLPVPSGASVLVAEARCGYVPMRWLATLEGNTRIIALDPSRAMLDQARQRMDEVQQRRVFFVPQQVSALSYAADDVFLASVCVNGLWTTKELEHGLKELVRVTVSEGKVVIAAPLWNCFSELYDMLHEALRVYELEDALKRIQAKRRSLIHEGDVLAAAKHMELQDIELDCLHWRVSFHSGRDLLASPLIRELFFEHWVSVIRVSDRDHVLRYVVDAIDTYFHERTLTCQMHAICLRASVL